jgi:hypothetical protein
MNPKSLPHNPLELLAVFESIVDELIQDEREEQEAILKRQTGTLPVICGRIDQHTLDLNRVQSVLSAFWPKPNAAPELGEPGRRTIDKLKKLQQLTIQNHLLLEHHLTFLREIHREILGISDKPFLLYDDAGMMSGEWTESGALLNAKV